MSLCGDDHPKLIARINRIEGQIRGLKKMVAEEQACLDVLKQIAAASGALRSLGAVILEDHLKGCVANAIRNHDHESELIAEVVDIFNKFSK
ncbi:MAG: metal-sensitive transcriptional regulator [Deltaproteobacteria bacterium]|nr:metal-sensitive transcriptional regulator [Deltaproteobacteria bacterium]